LAEIAERGDPGALFDELRSQLRMTGRDLTDLTRSQQLALSSAFGMNIEEFQRMAGVTPDIGDEESPNKFLKFLVDNTERIAGILTGLNTIMGSIHTFQFRKMIGLLKKIEGRGGIGGTPTPGGTGGGIGGTPTPGGTGGGSGSGSMLERVIGNVKPSQMLAAGAAMIMVAGATFILAKAMQEFSQGVTWEGVMQGIISLGALTLAMIALGLLMKSGVGAVAILAGAAAMVIMAGSVMILGKALQAVGTGFGMIGTGISTMISSLSSVGTELEYLISKVGGILKLSFAIAGLATALLLLGTLGATAIPVLLVIAAAAGAFGAVKSLAGSIGKNKSTENDTSISRPGYGDRTLVTPTSTVALNNQDNVIAYADDMISTNTGVELLSKGAIAKDAKGPSPEVNVKVDLQSLEKKLDQVIAAVASMQVVMDGNKVGKVMSNNEQRAATMGVFRTQRLPG
jgi:hypothetical protein